MDITNLTFGNYKVILQLDVNDVIITCKGVTGKFSQITSYIKKTKGEDYPYLFSNNMIIRTAEGYKIACLRGTLEEATNIITECKKLLNNKKQKNG